MASRCDICDKKSYRGSQHTHHTGVAGGQWKKRATHTSRGFKPNLHMATISLKGVMTRVKACTNCIKRSKFDIRKALASAPAIA